jgi:hypothetical protein
MARRRYKPALGQLVFRSLVEWLPLEPPRSPPPPLPEFWWRRRREAVKRSPERSADRDARIIDRWVNRGNGHVLCGSWPAPHDHRAGGRLPSL